eukprot:scaffold6219_cov146-Cylindrotheca_fusiformis.AAC.12
MSSPERKVKLRTASDVIARLKWSFDDLYTAQNSIVGYDCRIHGPMEKCVDDFAGIDEGGDIPEHRIQYFRLKGERNFENLIFWDRLARVDRLFGSGNQDDALSSITVSNVSKAIATMKRIAEENAIRAQEKAKRRARQQARKAAIAKYVEMKPSNPLRVESKKLIGGERHVWEELSRFFVYDAETSDWTGMQALSRSKSSSEPSCEKIKLVTWNVLFDLQINEKHELVQGDDALLGDEDGTFLRWQKLLEILSRENADVVTLQEVTPRFLEQLQSCKWVKDHYCISACSKHPRGIDVYGNLMLWKYNSFSSCEGLHLCRDGNRNRAIILSLSRVGGLVFNIANVHLPADQYDDVAGESRDRSQSRQRELSAVVGKLQTLEQIQQKKKQHAIPFLIGDFNNGPSDPELLQAGFWFDAWLHPSNVKEDDDGFTFDWKKNSRADKTRRHGHSEHGPRRIDRLFLGIQPIVTPVQSHLLGGSSEYKPPSDHFGVSTTVHIQVDSIIPEPILYNPSKPSHNAWATSGVRTTDSLLALVFESQEMANNPEAKLHDPESTLPLAHITLLHGFVDLSNIEAQQLAIQSVQDAVQQAVYTDDPSKQWKLEVDDQSLTIFEHRESASLVCVPQKSNDSWLSRLYHTLRATFTLCDEQESRFASGWTAHLSLGKFASTSDARTKLDSLISSGAWKSADLTCFGVGLFRRDVSDGKFYNVATVPLVDRRDVVGVDQTSAFLQDAGVAWFESMKGASSIVLYELQRACQYATNSLWGNRFNSRILPYGSQALGVSLPGISDVDAVVVLEPLAALPNGNTEVLVGASQTMFSGSEFLHLVASHLGYLHKFGKIRIRVSSVGGGPALYILTVKLAPNLPSADLLLARVDKNGVGADIGSQHALDSIEDARAILSSVQIQGLDEASFQGAVRIIKLWAHRRSIYGSSSGYLGGGGWAMLLAWVLENKADWKDMVSHHTDSRKAARQVAVYFFRNALTLWADSRFVALSGSSCNAAAVVEEERHNMAITLPRSGGSLGRSSTKSTTHQTWQELRRATQLLKESDGESNLEACLLPYVEESADILLIEVEFASAGIKPAEVKARGATLALSILVELERVLSADQIRPNAGAVRRNGSFWYFIGIQNMDKTTGQLLSEFVSTRNELLKQESSLGDDVVSRLERISREEYHIRSSN